MSVFKWEAEIYECLIFKGALSCLRQFLATESPLKMMEAAFNFTLKPLFVLNILKFSFRFFGHVQSPTKIVAQNIFPQFQC